MRLDLSGRFLRGKGRRPVAIRFFPRDDAIAQDSNFFDFALHHITNLEVPGVRIATESRNT
jgi:hypothetical protein